LWRNLYGLREAGKAWADKLTKILTENGLQRSTKDICLFYAPGRLTTVHVDDLYALGITEPKLMETVTAISDRLPTTGKNKITQYLGMHVQRVNNDTYVSCGAHIDAALRRFGIEDDPLAWTPATERLDCRKDDEPLADVGLMQAVIGTLLWISRMTRPDIQFAIHQLCSSATNPAPRHLLAARRILQYLKATRDYGLRIRADATLEIEVYADADFMRNGGKKSVSGVVVMCGGSAIEWSAKNQDSIATSTFAAELAAAYSGACHAVYYSQFLQELQLRAATDPVTLYDDNSNVISHANRMMANDQARVIPNQYFKIREWTKEGILRVLPIPSKENLADILTKPLGRTQFEYLRNKMGIVLIPQAS
jgi:hypothetical protein